MKENRIRRLRAARDDRRVGTVSRREFLAGVSAAASAPLLAGTARAGGLGGALPLRNLGLEHLDILVPDTAASARFYMRIFDAPLHEQSFQGTIRYFVLLGDLPEDRQVGYVAIGARFERPTQIGHYCALAAEADLEAVGGELEAAGYPLPGGGFGMIPDPDGLDLQLFSPPAGLVGAAVPSDLPVQPGGLVTPVGMDHILLYVSDMARSLEYYRFLYGEGLERRDPGEPERVWFELESDTRLGLQAAPAGEAPRIERFGLKVAPFDQEAVLNGLHEIGALVLSSPDQAGMVRFRDDNGITLQIDAAPA